MLTLILLICLLFFVSFKRYVNSYTLIKTTQKVLPLLLLWTLAGEQLVAQINIQDLLIKDTVLSRRTMDGHFADGMVLLLDDKILQGLIKKQPREWTITVPSDDTGPLTLKLNKRQLFTEDFTYNRSATEELLDIHYTGSVENYPNSTVALSLSPTAVSGLIQLPSKTIAIQRLAEGEESDHVLYDYKKRARPPVLDCADTDTISIRSGVRLERKRATDDPACVAVRVEVAYDFRGDVTALMNQVASIYEDIGIDLKVSEIYHWTRRSPYQGTTREIINSLKDALKNRNDLKGDLTLFIAARGNGGRASSVGIVCDPTAVCYSGQNDDVYTVAHELGHLFSAHHSHACKWNGNNTAIDGCGYNAGYGGCPGQDPPSGGTIMSYCHIRSVGVNLEFHPQVAAQMYNFLKDKEGCTCKSISSNIVEEVEVVEEIEEEYEEVDAGSGGDNIVANICTMSFINPKNCTVDIHAITNNEKGNLLVSVGAQATVSTPIIKNVKYGVFANGVLLDEFNAECGSVFSVVSCGVEGNRVTGQVILEGFYDTYSGKMHQQLIAQNLLSKTNPYLQAPWNYTGVTAVDNIPPDAVDWILVMSRDTEGKILGQSVGFVNTAGQLMDVYGKLGIPVANAEGHHLSIHHRGHMAVMAATPYQTGRTADFTASENMVLGNGQLKPIGQIYALHAGDFDANGVINNMDYNHWVSNSSKINLYIAADGDGNGVINNKDYNLWIANRSKIGHMPLHY